MLNLDTHVLLFALNGELTRGERAMLDRHEWSISAIVLWELCKLYQLGRISLDPSSTEFTDALQAVAVWPVTLDIARQSTRLDFKSDPADELIAATSIVHDVPLLTRDKRIQKSKTVPLARR